MTSGRGRRSLPRRSQEDEGARRKRGFPESGIPGSRFPAPITSHPLSHPVLPTGCLSRPSELQALGRAPGLSQDAEARSLVRPRPRPRSCLDACADAPGLGRWGGASHEDRGGAAGSDRQPSCAAGQSARSGGREGEGAGFLQEAPSRPWKRRRKRGGGGRWEPPSRGQGPKQDGQTPGGAAGKVRLQGLIWGSAPMRAGTK